ncbi:MAG: glycoside hydrolase family 10 protein [Halanaerobium sp.]
MTKKFIFTLVIITLIVLLFPINTAAYFEPEVYRSSLLEIRAAERALNDLDKKLTAAENNFRIMDQSIIDKELGEINLLYSEIQQAYRNEDDSQLQKLSNQIIEASNQIILQTVESKPVQLRAFWLDSGTLAKTEGREGVRKLLDLAEKANFNAVFPETFYKGMALIPDNELFVQDPRFKSWQEDPLKVLVEEAAARNIEVHPWVWVFNENTAGSPGRILTENPDWANKNKKGEIVSYHNSTWLSPARKDVRDYLQERYVYLVENYDLDGLNLDYIRFPEEYRGSFGYDSVSVEKFKEEFELDPFEIKSGSSEFAIWNQYREDLITKMVRETSQKLKAAEPDLLISADVIPGREEARYRALQNWSYWLQESYIDFVLPMTYTENLFSELSSWVKEDRDEIAGPLYAGISVFKLSPEQVISQIEEINQINPNGLSLFAAAHLTENDYQTLAQGVFAEPALIPHKNKKESLAKMQDFILKRLNIITEAEQIKNEDLIKIRSFVSQIDQDQSISDLNFAKFVEENELKISEKAVRVLESDFNYLKSIMTLY